MADLATVVMSEQDARKLTERIRKGAESLKDLLLQAYEHGAWKALGYRTWTAYLNAEFEIVPGHATRLLAQARAIREISVVTGISPEEAETALSARAVAELGPEVVAEVGAEVAAVPLVERARSLRERISGRRRQAQDVVAPQVDTAQDVPAEPEDDETPPATASWEASPADDAREASPAEPRREQAAAALLPPRDMEVSQHKLEQAATLVQQLVGLPPSQVAEAYLGLPDDKLLVKIDDMPALVEAWAKVFATEIQPF